MKMLFKTTPSRSQNNAIATDLNRSEGVKGNSACKNPGKIVSKRAFK
jgi:hypothetical protein